MHVIFSPTMNTKDSMPCVSSGQVALHQVLPQHLCGMDQCQSPGRGAGRPAYSPASPPAGSDLELPAIQLSVRPPSAHSTCPRGG